MLKRLYSCTQYRPWWWTHALE